MAWVYRNQMVEGETVFGIIHNSSYFFSKLAVYEDGIISCWKENDLNQFRDSLERGWVVPQIPIGESISIYELGYFPVLDARWQHDKKSYFKYIEGIVRRLNPEMKNLYYEQPRVAQKWKDARVLRSASPTECKMKNKIGYSLYDGKSHYIFYKGENNLELTLLTAYKDKTLRIEAKGDIYYSLDEIFEMFNKNELVVNIDDKQWVKIEGIGEVLLGENKGHGIQIDEMKSIIKEMVLDITGEETAHDKCVRAYHQYLEYPSNFNREMLRKAYEAVPESERMFLGDMDTRDSDYIRILYNPDVKREV